MIELPFPAKILWPNGRGHWGAKAFAFKNHKHWAYLTCRASYPVGLGFSFGKTEGGRVNWSVIIHPKTAHAIDDDNARASLKAYQDGLAMALGVDDKQFNAPALTFGTPIKGGKVIIEIEAA